MWGALDEMSQPRQVIPQVWIAIACRWTFQDCDYPNCITDVEQSGLYVLSVHTGQWDVTGVVQAHLQVPAGIEVNVLVGARKLSFA